MRAALVALLLLVSRAASAGGFALPTQAADALGTSNAFSAQPEQRSAPFYNPAAAAGRQGLSLYAGSMVAGAEVLIDDRAAALLDRNVTLPGVAPHLHVSYGQGDFGATFFAGGGYGAYLLYPEGWRGRHEIVELDMKVVGLNGNLTWRPTKRLRLAAGVQVYSGTFAVRNRIDLAAAEPGLRLEGKDDAVAPSASLLFQHNEALHLGVTFRGGARMKFFGDATFTDVPGPLTPRLYDQDARIELPLPARVTFAAHWQATGGFGLGIEFEYHRWRDLDAIRVVMDDPRLDRVSVRNFNDTVALRAGGEWKLTEWFIGRGGLVYDPRLAPDFAVSYASPDNDRLGASLGFGLRFGRYALDGGYSLLFSPPRQGDGGLYGPAKYSARTHLVALSAGLTL